MKESEDGLVYFSGAPLKITERGPDFVKIGGYAVLFTGPADPDLENEFFDATTDFGVDFEDGASHSAGLYYHHGFDATLQNRRIGKAAYRKDEAGLWMEAQLKLRDDYEKRIADMVAAGQLGYSTQAAGSLVTYEAVGKAWRIKSWPIGEISLTPTPAEPRTRAVPIKSLRNDPTPASPEQPTPTQAKAMTNEEILAGAKQAATDAAKEAVAAAVPGLTASLSDAMKATIQAALADKTQPNEPAGQPDNVTHTKAPQFSEPEPPRAPAYAENSHTWRYDHHSPADLAATYTMMKGLSAAAPNGGFRYDGTNIVHALGLRLTGADGQTDNYRAAVKSFQDRTGRPMKTFKADEMMQSVLVNGGDEWIGVAYSGDLWDEIRSGTQVWNRFPSREAPAGAESIVIPTIDDDVTVYKVSQASAMSASKTGIATNTVQESKMNTGNVTVTLAKFGSRSFYTGELLEDSVLDAASEIRRNHSVAFAEHLESALIDGDTTTATNSNINKIGVTPGTDDYYLNWDGLRHLPLITTTANAVSVGTLTVEDLHKLLELTGTSVPGQAYTAAGGNLSDFAFIPDLNVYGKMRLLPEVLTKDVFSGATVENGRLTSIFGVDIIPSAFFHYLQSARKANTAGKVDAGTDANNTTGSVLCVKFDRWRLYWRRRMTMEVTRIAAADAYEIVCLARAGFKNRDGYGSAIGYNVSLA